MSAHEADIRASYDAVASRYAEEFADDLTDKILDRALLAAFAETVRRTTTGDGSCVADLGCGPGYEARQLAGLGLDVVGVDLSPAMIAEAQRRNMPHRRLEFRIGSLLALPFADAALAGAISIYSVIHLPREDRTRAYREMARVIRPGGSLLISVHTSAIDFPPGSIRHMDEWWGHTVALDGHFIDADEVIADLHDAGFSIEARLERGPSTAREFPSRRAYLLAMRHVAP